jgi:hypothetical protein
VAARVVARGSISPAEFDTCLDMIEATGLLLTHPRRDPCGLNEPMVGVKRLTSYAIDDTAQKYCSLPLNQLHQSQHQASTDRLAHL